MISIIIPVFNESAQLKNKLPHLQWLRAQGHEILVADGGSKDDSLELARQYADQVLTSASGRARQMNAAARIAKGDILLFLHVDTVLSEECIASLKDIMSTQGLCWGRFDVSLSGRHILLRIIGKMMNLRSAMTGIATGDQAIFVSSKLFQQCGGYAAIPLMEDIDLCRRLKSVQGPVRIREKVITSSRRWEQKGILRTVFLMWKLRLAYWWGTDPAILARQYYPGNTIDK